MRKKILILLAAGALAHWCNNEFSFADEQKSYNLGKVVVAQSRIQETYADSTANISVLEEEDIKDSGASEIYKILETLPSVDIIEYGSNGAAKTVHTRGVSNTQVITLVDGRLTNTPRDGITDFNKIPLSNIERIEVLRGPASSIYGANAIGGVINVITKQGAQRSKDTITVKYGSQDTRITQMATSGKQGRFDYFFSGGWQRSSGFRDNSDYKQWDVNSNIGFDPNQQNRLKFSGGYWSSELGAPGQITNEDPDDRQNAWNGYTDLTYDGTLWQDTKIFFKGYEITDRLEFIETTAPTYDISAHLTKVYGTTIQASQWWFDIFRTTLGTDLQEHKINSSTSKKHKYNFKAAYLETEVKPVKSLNIKGGARTDDYSNFGDRVSPSASFSWWPSDALKFHGLWAKSFRAPTFNDLYWPREDWGVWGGVEGNPNVKPETAKSYEIGMTAYAAGSAEIDITYFNNKFKDLIAWQADSSWWYRPANLNKALIQGIELNANIQPFKKLKTNFNYTYLKAEDTTTSKWLEYRPRNTYKGSVNYDFTEKLTTFLTGKYTTKRYVNPTNTVHLKDYFAADSNIIYRLNDTAEINFTVNNIFDKDYQEEYNYPMPGTAYTLGARLTF